MLVRFTSILACLLLCLKSVQADELNELLKYVPEGMNTAAVINVAAINKTPRAVREKWADNHETEYLAGALSVPPWAKVVAIGAALFPGELSDARRMALLPVDSRVDVETVAKRENGIIQSVGDRKMVLSPRRGYLALPAGGIVAVSSSLPRQEFCRWLRMSSKAEKPTLPKYVLNAIANHGTSHVLIATDLSDMWDPTSMRLELIQSNLIRDPAMIDVFLRRFMGIRGLTFTAEIGDKHRAEVRIDFDLEIGTFLPTYKAFVPKSMELAGLDIEEFRSAEITAKDSTLLLKTDLSDASLRRLLSIVYSSGSPADGPETTPTRSPKESATLTASLRFYRSVNSTLDDLKTQGGARSKDYAKSALWYETYASKIERLPIQDVDSNLLKYGASVAAKLRALGGSLRGLKMQLDAYDSYTSVTVAQSGGLYITPGGRVGIAPAFDTQMDSNVAAIRLKQAELVIKLEPERVKLWEVIDKDRSSLRRELLEKYKIDFEQFKK